MSNYRTGDHVSVARPQYLPVLKHTLTRARQDGSYLNYLRSLSRTEVLIMDDWMRDPIQLSAAQGFFEIFDDRFGKSATIIVSQVPFSDWHARFPDPTQDRTVHNAYGLA